MKCKLGKNKGRKKMSDRIKKLGSGRVEPMLGLKL